MLLWHLGRTGTLALVVAGGLSACADDPLYWTCTSHDSDGHTYQSTNVEPVAADQTAFSDCNMTASDPASCQSQGCQRAR